MDKGLPEYEAGDWASQEHAGGTTISGRAAIIAHLRYPTETFTAPMADNPWLARREPAKRRSIQGSP
jgi:hypothetical protein